jgi:hypothetical protein
LQKPDGLWERERSPFFYWFYPILLLLPGTRTGLAMNNMAAHFPSSNSRYCRESNFLEAPILLILLRKIHKIGASENFILPQKAAKGAFYTTSNFFRSLCPDSLHGPGQA